MGGWQYVVLRREGGEQGELEKRETWIDVDEEEGGVEEKRGRDGEESEDENGEIVGADEQDALGRRREFHAQVLLFSSIFIWRSTWTDQGAHREGCWFCICLAFPKIRGILALLHKESVLCIICTVACSVAIKWVTSSSRNVVCTATAHSASVQPSAPVLLAFFTVLCLVPRFAGFVQECG